MGSLDTAMASPRIATVLMIQRVLGRRFGTVPCIATSREETYLLQHSILNPVTRRGIGLHSGKEAVVTIFPSNAGRGRFFTFKDGSESDSEVPARADYVVDTTLSTCIERGRRKVCTVEHILSALESLGVHNCHIQLEGNDEVPLLDGSALQWAEAIDEAGVCVAKDETGNFIPIRPYTIKSPLHVHSGDSFVAAFPAPATKITYGIDFPKHQAIGRQWFTWCSDPSAFRLEIAPARTFGLYEQVRTLTGSNVEAAVNGVVMGSTMCVQIEMLRAAGLIKGGSLENALICSMESGWLNPPLRFVDEPCRHKLLDLLGDLSLCSRKGQPGLPIGHIIAYKASHSLHVKFCKVLLEAMQGEEQQSAVAYAESSNLAA